MIPSDFYNNKKLGSIFGKSRVEQTIRRLKEFNEFPSHYNHVTPKQAAMFLYCIGSTDSPSEVPERIFSVNDLVSRNGEKFIDALTFLLTVDSELLKTNKIIIYKNFSGAAIIRNNQIEDIYMIPGSEYPEGVKYIVTFEKQFMLWFKTMLINSHEPAYIQAEK
jgi:hypothetical protein